MPGIAKFIELSININQQLQHLSDFNKLKQTLQVHFTWEERRVKFLTMFMMSVLKMRTVSLSHLAIVLNPLVSRNQITGVFRIFFRSTASIQTVWGDFF